MTNKKLSIGSIEQEYQKTQEMVYYTLQNGEEIGVYEVFSYDKINKLLEELHDYIVADSELENEEEKFFDEDGRLFQFTYYLAIKYFTDFGEQLPDGYEENLLLFDKMVGLGLFEEIINDVMPVEELGKVTEKIIDRHRVIVGLLESREVAQKIVRVKQQKADMKNFVSKK